MGDTIDGFRDLKEHRKQMRAKHGVSCPGCSKIQPKRIPTLLMPGQRCRVCGHVDQRTPITGAES